MKKIIATAMLLLMAAAMLSAGAKEEAIQSLDNAKIMLGKDDFAGAQNEIDYAQTKIAEILAEQLLPFIPEAPAGFRLEEKNAKALGSAGAILGSANSIMATAKYSRGDAELNLTISSGGVLGQAGGLLGGIASMFGGLSVGSGAKTIRVKGYTGTQEFDPDEESGTLSIQVGEKISVIVEAHGIGDAGLMIAIAEAVDLARLESSF